MEAREHGRRKDLRPKMLACEEVGNRLKQKVGRCRSVTGGVETASFPGEKRGGGKLRQHRNTTKTKHSSL